MEVSSKHLNKELLEKLKKAGESEAEKHLGSQQVLCVVERIRSILQRNRLAPAFSDLKQVIDHVRLADCVGGDAVEVVSG